MYLKCWHVGAEGEAYSLPVALKNFENDLEKTSFRIFKIADALGATDCTIKATIRHAAIVQMPRCGTDTQAHRGLLSVPCNRLPLGHLVVMQREDPALGPQDVGTHRGLPAAGGSLRLPHSLASS